jgi:hypothetical protein
MRGQLLLTALLACGVWAPAAAQPAAGLEGHWVGSCRGTGKSGAAQVVIGPSEVRMNGRAATGLSRTATTIRFQADGGTFEGVLSSDGSSLAGKLSGAGKGAKTCRLVRKAG